MHLIIILVIVLIIFGPGKLPDIGASIGKTIRGFKQAMNEPEKKPEEDTKKIDDKTQPKEQPGFIRKGINRVKGWL